MISTMTGARSAEATAVPSTVAPVAGGPTPGQQDSALHRTSGSVRLRRKERR